jgi:hypothetical protein
VVAASDSHVLNCVGFHFIPTYSAKILRIASDKDGLSSCCLAHASIALRTSGGMRTATVSATSLPIRGRPIFFFGFICFSFAKVVALLMTFAYIIVRTKATVARGFYRFRQ